MLTYFVKYVTSHEPYFMNSIVEFVCYEQNKSKIPNCASRLKQRHFMNNKIFVYMVALNANSHMPGICTLND